MFDFIAGIIVMLLFSVISSIPIFITGFCCKKRGGYSTVVAWILTIVCVFLYIVIKVFAYDAAGISNTNATPVPIIAMFIIYGFANLFVNRDIPSLFDTNNTKIENKKHSENN